MFDDIKLKWNNKVDAEDYIFVLGDVVWNATIDKVEKVLNQLNGKKIVILGNHDKEKCYLSDSIFYSGKLEKITIIDDETNKLKEIVLCHYPLSSWENMHKDAWMLHGHCHGTIDEKDYDNAFNIVDVGLDSKLSNHDIVSFKQIKTWFENKDHYL